MRDGGNSPKLAVKRKYPDATCRKEGPLYVVSPEPGHEVTLGAGRTPMEAWVDAHRTIRKLGN